ncbi:MAG: hypothetical protein AB7E55_25075 [Pigmentiphaga sp.]
MPASDDLDFSKLDTMTGEEEARFMDAFTQALTSDDGGAVQAHLRAGRAVYYRDADYADGVIKELPSGEHQLVHLVDGAEVLERQL